MHVSVLAVIAAAAAFGSSSLPALAITTYGVPIESLDPLDTTPVGIVDGDHNISFYIPLDGEEYYNSSGGGQSSDTCWDYNGCVGGQLHMYLQYTPVFPVPPGNDLTVNLEFTDLDLDSSSIDWNDPAHFFEKLIFYDDADPQNVLAEIDNLNDAGGDVLDISVNEATDTVLIQIALHGVTDPFRAELLLSSYSDLTYDYNYYTWNCYWSGGSRRCEKVWHTATHGGIEKKSYNTIEALKTWIESSPPEVPPQVPLPPALPLLGMAVAGLGLVGRRRRHRATDSN